jgi:hypothetical protein
MASSQFGGDGLPLGVSLQAGTPEYRFLPDPARTAYQYGYPAPTPDYQGRGSRVTRASQIVAVSLFDQTERVTAPQITYLDNAPQEIVQLLREPDTDSYDGTMFPDRGV